MHIGEQRGRHVDPQHRGGDRNRRIINADPAAGERMGPPLGTQREKQADRINIIDRDIDAVVAQRLCADRRLGQRIIGRASAAAPPGPGPRDGFQFPARTSSRALIQSPNALNTCPKRPGSFINSRTVSAEKGRGSPFSAST